MSPDLKARNPAQASLTELPPAALESVFVFLDRKTRNSLASTCRKLLALSQGAALNAEVRFHMVVGPASHRKAEAFYDWLLHRRAHVERLRIDVRRRRDDAGTWDAAQHVDVWTTMCSSIVAVSPTLRKLAFHWPFTGVAIGHWITAASRLEELRLQNHSLVVKESVLQLPNLRTLSLDSQLHPELPWHRECTTVTKLLLSVPGNRLPPATTNLRALVALVVDFPLAELPVEGLAGLTSLAVVSASALGLPPQVSALTGLRQLILEEHVFPRGDDDDHLSPLLSTLRALTLLSLSRCALPALPAAVPGLTALRALLVDGCLLPALPRGPYLSRLSVLSMDWGAVFNSCRLLREQALSLAHLYAATTCWAGPPRADAADVLRALRAHPTLRRLTVLADAELEGFVPSEVNRLLLRAEAALPGLEIATQERGCFHPHTLPDLSCFELPVDGIEDRG